MYRRYFRLSPPPPQIESLETLARVALTRDAKTVGESVVGFYNHVMQTQISLRALFESMAKHLRGAHDPLYKAGIKIAVQMDKQDTGNPYHNNFHAKKVMINAFVLALIAERQWRQGESGEKPLEAREKLKLIFKALIHDLRHSGRDNGGVLYLLEDKAVRHALPAMKKAGVGLSVRRATRTVVRWTDLNPVARKRLQKNPRFDASARRLASLLGDADIMASVALTSGQAYRETKDLSEEWQKAGKKEVGAEGFEAFELFVLGEAGQRKLHSGPGKFLSANIARVFSGAERALGPRGHNHHHL